MATNSPFADPRLCAAIADRITFRCVLIQTGIESYRFQATETERRARTTMTPYAQARARPEG
ncbi:ATP-binding protein [Streptomyces sp. SKN60]|uniref:hypothetical protein n=1 Tax=Streptomyces sp. SKN60 TaxID=2855506 RepID=UPI0022453EB9|nr:hypothetical protein [Streptomyces sp. SKN60]MCX2182673.1 ATP-binding protein [Streptomyces sp. SKN60]